MSRVKYLSFALLFILSFSCSNHALIGEWDCVKRKVNNNPVEWLKFEQDLTDCAGILVFHSSQDVIVKDMDLNFEESLPYTYHEDEKLLKIGQNSYKVLMLDSDSLILKDTLGVSDIEGGRTLYYYAKIH